MKNAIILHNPGAGEETHEKGDLKNTIEKKGYKCKYYPIKKDDSWAEELDKADFVVVAGGDGTVRRVAKELVKRTLISPKIPLAILPMGTANNLSKTFGLDIDADYAEIVNDWMNHRIKSFDVGIVNEKKNAHFFLEGAGFGVFPLLIQEMEKKNVDELETREEELKLALEVLHELILTSPATHYTLEINNKIFSGKCILLEILNTPYIGPNLKLAPKAKVDDGTLHIVCIEESERDKFASYVRGLIDGKSRRFICKSFICNKLTVTYDQKLMHVDDELVSISKKPINFEIRERILDFIV